MRAEPRRRRYVDRRLLSALRPLLRYSANRDAYVLRVIGGTTGPVLREDRRRSQEPFLGPDRRMLAGLSDRALRGSH